MRRTGKAILADYLLAVSAFSPAEGPSPHPLISKARPKLPVPGVAKAGDDVAAFVEVIVNGGKRDGNLRVGGEEPAQPFWSADHADKANVRHAPTAQDVHRCDSGAARGEHRIKHETHINRGRWRQPVVVLDRNQPVFVTVDAEMPDLRFREKMQRPLQHARPCTEDGRQADARRNRGAGGSGQRRLDDNFPLGKVPAGLIGEEDAELFHQLAESPRARGRVAQLG